MGELTAPAAGNRLIALEGSESGFATTKLEDLLGWARKYSLFAYPFVTACCGMEFMAVTSPRYDISRFGAEAAPRFSPRQGRPALGGRHDQASARRRCSAASVQSR